MNFLIVLAHPEPRSLTSSLKNIVSEHLENTGHQVEISDLYAMGWNPLLGKQDNSALDDNNIFDTVRDIRKGFENASLASDIVLEQEKLIWADVAIFIFPLWWYTMPAIMKGWFDRVYVAGFAHSVGEHSDTHWGDRYGEGTLAGKRAMLMVTVGGQESHYDRRGVNGYMDDILFPIQHGILFYPGYAVMPPCVIYNTYAMSQQRLDTISRYIRDRLNNIFTDSPIPFRLQNGGDYKIPELTLREDIKPDEIGFGIHVKDAK